MAVLVTRPDERGKQLTDMLNKAGIVALHLPLFTIETGNELNLLPNKLNQLNTGDYVFSVSKSAVDFSAESLKNTGFHWRQDLHYFTVGQRTAEYFTRQIEQPVRYPCAQENSEGVLALSPWQDLQGKNVLILRGNGGRELLAETAELRGAKVEALECYRREPIFYNNLEQTSICKRSGVQTIVATSMEMLKLLMDFVPPEEQSWLKNCLLVTVSERIAHYAKSQGWQQVAISAKADNQTLLQTLLKLHQ